MTAGNESGFALEVLHFYVAYHVASHFLECRWRLFAIAQYFERNHHLRHFFPYDILPKRVPIFLVNSEAIIVHFRYFDTKFICPFMIASVDGGDDSVSTFEGKRYPPGECRLRIQTVDGGVICNLDEV